MNRLLVSLVLMHLVAGLFADTYEEKSVMEGDSVTLHIKPDEIQGAEKLLWTFNKNYIAKINIEDLTSSVPGNDNGTFKDRLKLNNKTGDLTITDMRSTDSGLYQLQISKTTDAFKKFNVTVTASVTEPDERSHWVITGPLLAVGLMLLGGLLIIYKRCINKRSSDDEKETEYL